MMLDGPDHPATAQAVPIERIRCLWCNEEFTRRQNGGSRQRFCQSKCRAKFHKAARIWTEREIAEGRLTIEELRVVL